MESCKCVKRGGVLGGGVLGGGVLGGEGVGGGVLGGRVLGGRNLAVFIFYFCHMFAHAKVLIYTPKCMPFSMLSNGMFCLPTHAF